MTATYRILIIDDEPVVREGIAETIDWNRHGFDLVGACRDGREGLREIERLQPDVVLTDICMPFVDGLELAGVITDRYPTIRTVLLTGYDEFEYAREALRLRVSDFLLKPITADELRSKLEELREELDRERDHRRERERLNEQLKASLPVYRERFLNRLVQGTIPREERERTEKLLALELQGPGFAVLLGDVDPRETDHGGVRSESEDAEDHLLRLALQNVVREVARRIEGSVFFSTPVGEAALLVSDADAERALSRALEYAEVISEQVKSSRKRTVSIGIGDPAFDITELPRAFGEARTALEHRLTLGSDQIVTVQQVRGLRRKGNAPDTLEGRSRFVQAVRRGSTAEATIAMADVRMRLQETGEEIDRCHVVLTRLLADTLDAVESIGIDYHEFPSLQDNPFVQLSGIKTLHAVERWFVHLAEEARQLLEKRRDHHSRLKAAAAVELIRERFRDPDLSLQAVCSRLAVSKSYLSPIFKAHTGMTFLEYLTDVRIQHAQSVLSSSDGKVYEVAEQAGFRDPHYFSSIFRKVTGYSPSEFRELSQQDVL